MNPERRKIADDALGWLLDGEGEYLHELALKAPAGWVVEVGAYCGKSTIWLGDAAEQMSRHLASVDHHLGSPEMQPGRENYNPHLSDAGLAHDTLTHWRRNVRVAGLEHTVVGIVAPSKVAAASWGAPIGLLFIDADHGYEGCRGDFDAWARHLAPDGLIAFHDTTIAAVERVVLEALRYGFRSFDEFGSIKVVQA